MMHPSELSFRSLITHAADLIAIVAPDGCIRYISPAIETMLGYHPDAAIGTDVFKHVHPADAARLQQGFASSSTIWRLNDAVRIRHHNGTWRWLSITAVDRCADPALAGFVVQARDITEERWSLARPPQHIPPGSLAALPSPQTVFDRVDRKIAAGESVVMLFIGLDELDLVNEELGPSIADQVLDETLGRLRLGIRADDLLARDHDSQFILLLRQARTLDDARSVAERLIETSMAPLVVGLDTLSVSISVGMAAADAGTNAIRLVRHAGTAMKAAQRLGGARAVAYAADMEAPARPSLRLHNDLRRALANDEFRLEYQPIVALRTGQVTGVEALLRWPGAGLSPADFMPAAEDSGLIVPVGRWVIRHACRQVVAWNDTGIPLGVHVNLSVRQLDDADIVNDVALALADSGLEPGRLTLEITESVALDGGRHCAHLAGLRALGVRLAIDDFGTGYATPSSLRHGPFDEVKIDRSYIQDLETEIPARRVLRAMLGLAGATGLTVIAEGVETSGQFEILREFGCGLAQGFYIAHPTPADEIPELLERQPWKARWSTLSEPSTDLADPGRLAALYRFGLLDTPTEAVFDEVTHLASSLLDVPTTLITLIDRDRQFFKSGYGLPESLTTNRWLPLSHSICKEMVASREPLVIEDARVDPRVCGNLAVEAYNVIGYAGVPITTAEGHTIGGLCALSAEPHAWSDDEIGILRSLASLVMQIISLRDAADPLLMRSLVFPRPPDLAFACYEGGTRST